MVFQTDYCLEDVGGKEEYEEKNVFETAVEMPRQAEKKTPKYKLRT